MGYDLSEKDKESNTTLLSEQKYGHNWNLRKIENGILVVCTWAFYLHFHYQLLINLKTCILFAYQKFTRKALKNMSLLKNRMKSSVPKSKPACSPLIDDCKYKCTQFLPLSQQIYQTNRLLSSIMSLKWVVFIRFTNWNKNIHIFDRKTFLKKTYQTIYWRKLKFFNRFHTFLYHFSKFTSNILASTTALNDECKKYLIKCKVRKLIIKWTRESLLIYAKTTN